MDSLYYIKYYPFLHHVIIFILVFNGNFKIYLLMLHDCATVANHFAQCLLCSLETAMRQNHSKLTIYNKRLWVS